MVKVYSGGVKKKFSSSEAATAANKAGQSPPTSAARTTATRKSSITLARESSARIMWRTMVSSGRPIAAPMKPASRRRPERVPCR